MIRLLVNAPSGEQQIVLVGEGGWYFDPTRVIWDERIDGTLPDDVQVGGMVRLDGELVFSQERMNTHLAASRPPVPQTVTMRQARLALLAAGKLSAVDAAIVNLPSPQKEAAQIEWEFSSVVERDRPLVQMLGPALGLFDADLDALFIQAAQL